jgi:lipoprotein-anchoring transpeptidase ErfK/SrfK
MRLAPATRVAAFLAAAVALVAAAAPGTASAATPTESIVAEAKGPVVAVYRTPSANRAFLRLSNPTGHGGPLVFLVKERRPGWEKVYLPVRPNGATGWIRDAQVSLALNTYRIQVSLGGHTITVWNGKRIILHAPAGVGRSIVPTPVGTYYLAELLAQPNPNGPYGPYAFGLSAHSNVLYSFGGGPGQIGLHGTNEPASLGTNASHGCIRISNAGITKLARILPLGTPVRIGY